MILASLFLALDIASGAPPLGSYPVNSGYLVGKSEYVWPNNVMAPYLSLKKFPAFDIKSCISNTSVKTFILSSVNGNKDGIPSWHGTDSLNDTFYAESINDIRTAGGDVAVSFGGGKGYEFSTENFIVLASKYQRVIDTYKLKFIDIDIQSNMSETLSSINNRVKAFNLVKINNPQLTISLSFLASISGFDSHSKAVLSSCKKFGFTPDIVNLFTMDFENARDGKTKMGDYAISALENGQQNLRALSLKSKMGMTFMIGVNDVHDEIFQIVDAEKVLKWAKKTNYMSLLSFWSVNRDNGDINAPLFASSQIEQTTFQFTNILKSWTKNSFIQVPKKEHKTVVVASKIFAPMVDILSWPTFDIIDAAKATNHHWYNLLCITSNGHGNATWGGNVNINEHFYMHFIETLRTDGGDIVLTFGGRDGIELALDTFILDAEALAAKYQEVLDIYTPTIIDFHFHKSELNDTLSIEKRNSALSILLKANPSLRIIFTLPVDKNGLTADGISILKSAITTGVQLNVVNILSSKFELMIANYGSSEEIGLHEIIITSAQKVFSQTRELGLEKTTIGVTPVIGVSKAANETFGLDDARKLVAWTKEQSFVTYLSFLSANRDTERSGSAEELSQIPQSEYEFTKIFHEWSSIHDVPETQPTHAPATDFSLFPGPFQPDLSYSSGYRWASKVFAPYVNTVEPFDILKFSDSVGSARYIISFINLLEDGETVAWGSKVPVKNLQFLDVIQSIRLFGGEVIFSFGGPNGNDLAHFYTSLKSLTIAYQNIIDAYNIGWIDFYVDGKSNYNETITDLRNEALRNLQSSNPNLIISYSVQSGLDGMSEMSKKTLKSARERGVRVDVVNFLTWNFSDVTSGMPYDYVIKSASKSIEQLPAVGYQDAKVGVTTLIEPNPANGAEGFNSTDATALVKWAKRTQNVQLLSYIDANADTTLEFGKRFVQFEN